MTETTPVKKKRPNALSVKNTLKLYDWLKGHWERIEKHKPGMPAVAKQATDDLGFNVSWVNIRNIVHRDMERRWPGAQRVKNLRGQKGDSRAVNFKLDLLARELAKVIELLTTPGAATPEFHVDALRGIFSHHSVDQIKQTMLPFGETHGEN